MSSKSNFKDSPLSHKNQEPTNLEDSRKLIKQLRTELDSQHKQIHQLRREKNLELKTLKEKETTKFNILLKDQRTKLHQDRLKELEGQRESLTRKFEIDTAKTIKLKDAEISKLRNDLKKCQDELSEIAQNGLSASAQGSFVREQTRLESKLTELQGAKKSLDDDLTKSKETVKSLNKELQEEKDTHKLELQRLDNNHAQDVRKLLDELKTKNKMIVNKEKEMSTSIGLLEKLKMEKEAMNEMTIKSKQLKDEECELKKQLILKDEKEKNQLLNEKKELEDKNKTFELKIKALLDDISNLESEVKKAKEGYTKDIEDKVFEMESTEIFNERIEELKLINNEQEITIDALQKACAEKDRRIEIVSYNHRKARVKNKPPKRTVRFLLPARINMMAAGMKETYYQEDCENTDNFDTIMPSSPSFDDDQTEFDRIFDNQEKNDDTDGSLRMLYQRLSWEHIQLEKSHSDLQEALLTCQIEAQHNEEICGHLEANLLLFHNRIRELEDMLESSVTDYELNDITKPDEISDLNRQISELFEINEELEFKSLEIEESSNKIIKDMQENEIELQKKIEEEQKRITDLNEIIEKLNENLNKEVTEVSIQCDDVTAGQDRTTSDASGHEQEVKELELKVEELQKAIAVNKYIIDFNETTEKRYREENDSLKRKLESALEGKDYEQSVVSDAIRQLTLSKMECAASAEEDKTMQSDNHLKDLDDLKECLEENEKCKQLLTEDINELKLRIVSITYDYDQLQVKFDSLKSKTSCLTTTEIQTEECDYLHNLKLSMERLQKEFVISNTDNMTKRETIESQKEHIEMMQIEMEELHITNKYIQNNVEKRADEISSLKAKLLVEENEGKFRKEMHDELLKSFKDSTNEKQLLTEKCIVYEKELLDLKNSYLDDLSKENADLKEKMASKETEHDSCLSELNALKKELENSKSNLVDRTHELRELQCRLIDYEHIQKQLHIKVAESQQFKMKLKDSHLIKEQLEVKCNEVMRMQRELDDFRHMEGSYYKQKEEFANLVHDKKHVESNIIELENKLIQMKQENATLKERLADLSFTNENEKLQTLRESEEKLRKRVQVLEGSLHHRKSESEDDEEKIMSLEMQINELLTKEEQLKKACKEKDTSIEYLKEKVKELEDFKNDLHDYYLLRIKCIERNHSLATLPVFEDVELDKSWEFDSQQVGSNVDERLQSSQTDNLVAKIKSLESEASERERTIIKLQDEVARLQFDNDRLGTVSDERDVFYNIMSELNLLIYDKDELNEQIQKMKIIHERAVGDDEETSSSSDDFLKQKIDELSNKEMQFEHQINELEYELEEMHRNYKEEKHQNEESNSKIRDLEETEIYLRQQLARFEVNGSHLVDKCDELNTRTVDLESSLKTVRRAERDAKMKIQQYEYRENEMLVKFETIVDQYESSEQKLKSKLADAIEEKRKLLDDVDELTYRISELENLEAMLKQKIKHAESNGSSLENRLQRLESEENAGQLRVFELEKQKEDAMRRVLSLEDEKHNLACDISDIEYERDDYKNSLLLTADNYEFFKNKVESQASTIQDYEHRISELTEKEALLESQIKELIAQEEELDRKIVQLEKENAAFKAAKDSPNEHVQSPASETFTIKRVMPEFKKAMIHLENQHPEAYIQFSRTLYDGHLSKKEEDLYKESIKVCIRHVSDDEECVSEEDIEAVEKQKDPFSSLTSEDPLWLAIETGNPPSAEMQSEEKFWVDIENKSDYLDEMTITLPKAHFDDDYDGACSADEASEINDEEQVVAVSAHTVAMTPVQASLQSYREDQGDDRTKYLDISTDSMQDSGLGITDRSYKDNLEDKIESFEKELEWHKSASTLISKEDLEELEDELAKMKYENRRLTEEVEHLEGAQYKADALEGQVAELIEEIELLQEKILERSDELDGLQNENFGLKHICQAGEEEKDELESTIVDLRNQLNENYHEEKIISLEERIVELMKHETDLTKENTLLKEQIESLNKLIMELRKDDASLRKPKQKTSKSMSELPTVSIPPVRQLRQGPAMIKYTTEMDYFDQHFHRQHISLEKGSIVNIVGDGGEEDTLQIEVGGKTGYVAIQSLQTASLSPDVKMGKRNRHCSAEIEGLSKAQMKTNICSIAHPAFRRSYIPMGSYQTYPRSPRKSEGHVKVSHTSSYSSILEKKPISQTNNSAHTYKYTPQLHTSELYTHQPEPPENFRIERVVAKELVLLSWDLPHLDENMCSNGVLVEGYKISIDGLDEFHVTNPKLTKALIENIDISHPLTFSIQTIGRGSTLSISVDIYHNGSIREGAYRHKDDSLVLSGLPYHDSDSTLFLAVYDYDPMTQSSYQHPDEELLLRTGDIVVTFGKERDDGFYWGKVSGKQGLVPKYFLEEIAMPRPNTTMNDPFDSLRRSFTGSYGYQISA